MSDIIKSPGTALSIFDRVGWDRAAISMLRNKMRVPETAPDEDLIQLALFCEATGLSALAGHVYLVYRKEKGVEKATIQTSIDALRLAAHNTGLYAGCSEPLYDSGLDTYQWVMAAERGQVTESYYRNFNDQQVLFKHPLVCKISVYRLSQGKPYAYPGFALWSERYPGDKQGAMWRSMPTTMLSKCAEAAALRKTFQLGKVYIPEEMPLADDYDEFQGQTISMPVTQLDDPPTPVRPIPVRSEVTTALDRARQKLREEAQRRIPPEQIREEALQLLKDVAGVNSADELTSVEQVAAIMQELKARFPEEIAQAV